MALVNVKATAFLVGEEGFDLEATAVKTTGLISIGYIGDQKDRFFVATAPPANQVERYGGVLGEADLVAMEELTFRQRISANRLAIGAFLHMNLWRSTQNVLPIGVGFHPDQHLSGIVLRIPQQNHFTAGWQQRQHFLKGLNMSLCGRMPFLPFVNYPRNRQSTFLVQHATKSGRWGGCPPHRRYRTGHETFASSGS